MEMMDIVNDKDEVVGTASYQEIYAKQLPHRIVHILMFNEIGHMALQQRSWTKSFCPGHWSTAVGGHVQAGESYEQAAARECKEELGVKVPFQFLRKDWYTLPHGPNKFIATFTAVYNGPFTLNPDEVLQLDFFPLSNIAAMVEQDEQFHPELLYLLRQESIV